MKSYRKKPVVIQAVVWNGDNIDEVRDFCSSDLSYLEFGGYLSINTLEGKMRVTMGDYIIKGIQGEFYPCKPDIFKSTYEEVT